MTKIFNKYYLFMIAIDCLYFFKFCSETLCGEDSEKYNKLSIVYEYNIHHHIRNKLSLSINVILKPSEETNHL